MVSFNFADLKIETRRVVHDTLGVPAFYQDDSMSAAKSITARWFNKTAKYGDLVETGYAEVVEGVDRVVLFPCDYPTVRFQRLGVVTFPQYGRSFRLDILEPSDGPGGQAVWQVVQVKP